MLLPALWLAMQLAAADAAAPKLHPAFAPTLPVLHHPLHTCNLLHAPRAARPDGALPRSALLALPSGPQGWSCALGGKAGAPLPTQTRARMHWGLFASGWPLSRRLGWRRCAPARRATGAPGGVDGAAGDEEALAELAQLKRAANKGDAGAAAALARAQEVAARADAAFDVAEEDRNVFLMGSVLPAPLRPAPPRPAARAPSGAAPLAGWRSSSGWASSRSASDIFSESACWEQG
jgi:hypothetical protein